LFRGALSGTNVVVAAGTSQTPRFGIPNHWSHRNQTIVILLPLAVTVTAAAKATDAELL
jgi:hypothetical protein